MRAAKEVCGAYEKKNKEKKSERDNILRKEAF